MSKSNGLKDLLTKTVADKKKRDGRSSSVTMGTPPRIEHDAPLVPQKSKPPRVVKEKPLPKITEPHTVYSPPPSVIALPTDVPTYNAPEPTQTPDSQPMGQPDSKDLTDTTVKTKDRRNDLIVIGHLPLIRSHYYRLQYARSTDKDPTRDRPTACELTVGRKQSEKIADIFDGCGISSDWIEIHGEGEIRNGEDLERRVGTKPEAAFRKIGELKLNAQSELASVTGPLLRQRAHTMPLIAGLTAIVGSTESGKTTFARAITCLNAGMLKTISYGEPDAWAQSWLQSETLLAQALVASTVTGVPFIVDSFRPVVYSVASGSTGAGGVMNSFFLHLTSISNFARHHGFAVLALVNPMAKSDDFDFFVDRVNSSVAATIMLTAPGVGWYSVRDEESQRRHTEFEWQMTNAKDCATDSPKTKGMLSSAQPYSGSANIAPDVNGDALDYSRPYLANNDL